MEIKILSPVEVEFKEKDVQNAFERDLAKLEEGLEFIATEVMLGTGRIDTLAFDTNRGCPVFIEYKRRGDFNKDALIQLMDHLSWFARDENRMAILEKMIRRHKPDLDDFEPALRLICVVTDIDDRIRNAVYAINNHVKVFSYMVARDTANNVVLVPKLELDNGDIEPQAREAVSEVELLKKHPHLQEIFASLKSPATVVQVAHELLLTDRDNLPQIPPVIRTIINRGDNIRTDGIGAGDKCYL